MSEAIGFLIVFSIIAIASVAFTAVLAVRDAQKQSTRHARIRVHGKGSLSDPFTNSYKRAYVRAQVYDETKSHVNPKGYQLWIMDNLHAEVVIGRTYDITLYRKPCGWTITSIEKVPPTNYS